MSLPARITVLTMRLLGTGAGLAALVAVTEAGKKWS